MHITVSQGTHRVKRRKGIRGTLPAKEELLRCMEPQAKVQSKLKQNRITDF